MFTTRGFIAELVDGTGPNANVAATLGNMVIPFFQRKQAFPSRETWSPAPEATTAWISQYIDDIAYLGGMLAFNHDYGASESLMTIIKNRIYAIAPITFFYIDGSPAFGSYYLRLRNATGWYLVTDSRLPATFGSTGLRGHKPDGTPMDFTISMEINHQQYSTEMYVYGNWNFAVEGIDSDGKLSGYYTAVCFISAQIQVGRSCGSPVL